MVSTRYLLAVAEFLCSKVMPTALVTSENCTWEIEVAAMDNSSEHRIRRKGTDQQRPGFRVLPCPSVVETRMRSNHTVRPEIIPFASQIAKISVAGRSKNEPSMP